MKALRCSTVMPGAWASTMKAVMPPRCPSDFGTFAITTMRSAITPLVVQSLRPLITYPEPSGVGIAEVPTRAGSEPTSTSVSRKALMWVVATSGRYLRFCSSVPASRNGSGIPIDWWADSRVLSEECQVPARASARSAYTWSSPTPPYSSGIFRPRVPELLEPLDDVVRDPGIPLDLQRVDRSSRNARSEPRKASPFFTISGSGSGCGYSRRSGSGRG